MSQRESATIDSIDNILRLNLVIPKYQRPYKWTEKNITDLINDIEACHDEFVKFKGDFRYRIGSIILFHREDMGCYEVVDGQQRILSLLLLRLSLDPGFSGSTLLNQQFDNKETIYNLHNNYGKFRQWVASLDDKFKADLRVMFSSTLEAVILIVTHLEEAFQLFDSQNSRGRALYPHDLLKAFHLREIADKYELKSAVSKWEAYAQENIRELFDNYLFPIRNWSRQLKCYSFKSSDIDMFKGIEADSAYSYAKRAHRASPYFQLTETFIAGSDFFLMVDHYMQMLHNIKEEIITDERLSFIREVFVGSGTPQSVSEFDQSRLRSARSKGMVYAQELFLCSLLCYYDRFRNFNVNAVKNLLLWAMMLRLDMIHLGYDSINKYAIGDGNDRYSNNIAMFSLITNARRHSEIVSLTISVHESNNDSQEARDLLVILTKLKS